MVVLFGMTTFYVLRKSFFFANLKVENSSIGLVERLVYQLLTKGAVKLKQKHLVLNSAYDAKSANSCGVLPFD